MDILLDTHVLLWYLADDPRLPKSYPELLNDQRNRKFLSIVSLWEIAIKVSVGKLKLLQPLDELAPTGVAILSLQLSHLSLIQTLPYHHRDPFDRMLIAQALTENLAVLSVDSHFAAYGVMLL